MEVQQRLREFQHHHCSALPCSRLHSQIKEILP
jgi:hypothetical protein